MLAPIALYPDGVLADILMAATYPLEVIEADRWLADPHNASLKGDQLTAALDRAELGPSVKSLVPYPRILHMMDEQARMDRARRRSLPGRSGGGDGFDPASASARPVDGRPGLGAAGGGDDGSAGYQDRTAERGNGLRSRLRSFARLRGLAVSGLSPDYFPEFFDGATVGAFGCGWFGAPIVGPLWGWRHWDWRRHRIEIDRDKFAALNGKRPPIGDRFWEHDPSHRHGVPYRDPELRARFAGTAVPPEGRRALRGYPTGATPQIQAAPGAGPSLRNERSPANGVLAPPPVRRVPPAFESFGRGAEVRIESERGYSSRMSTPSIAPRGFAPQFAPPGGGARFRR